MAIKRKPNKKLYLILAVVLMICAIPFAKQMFEELQTYIQLQSQLSGSNDEIDELENEKEELQKQIDRLNDPNYIEIINKVKYGYLKAGEQIFILTEIND